MNSPGRFGTACALGLTIFSMAVFPAVAADELAWPPITSQARPWVWWWWHGSAVDETNIAHELQRFRDAGLGGAQITSIYGTKGAEARDIPYLSPRWLQMMGYTVDEARWLGLGVDMTLGSGWCFGGPTVSDEEANASVVEKTYRVAGGGQIDDKFNRNSTQALVAYSPDGKTIIDLTASISAAGDADWVAPAISTNPWTVYAISQKPSGQKVKRPGPGGEGWMLNPAYPRAMRGWLTWFDAALTNYSGSKPHGVFQDSYEYRTDWAPDFFDQFEELRGYKLQNELPALFGNAQDEHVARVKYDYRRTISDLMVQQSEPAWIDWAHQNGFAAIYQAHGTPGNWLDLYGEADIPETEMFHNDRSILVSKFASSAAHTQGRALTGAETGTWIKEHFTETLADLKYLADDMFLSGINHIYYHGNCYSPDDAPWPGWLFYASTEMNSRNPIWHDVPALNEYIARCQAVLQSGKPDNDVLLYWPVADFWSQPSGMLQPMAVGRTTWLEDQPVGKTAHELWDRGYQFDYISDAQISAIKSASYANVETSGGKYRAIVVPACKFVPLETMEKLYALAENGAMVVFDGKPASDVPGLNDLENQRKRLKELNQRIVYQPVEGNKVAIAPIGSKVARGWMLSGDLETALEHVGVLRESMADMGLYCTRRSFDGGDEYFIHNRSGTNICGWVPLGRPAMSAIILDPMSGKTGITPIQFLDENNKVAMIVVSFQKFTSEVFLQLQPGESIIVRAFWTDWKKNPPKDLSKVPKPIKGPTWPYWRTNGEPLEISGNWNVKFVTGGPTLPADFQTAKLASWTTFSDTNAQAFAGTANYEITFDAPKAGGKAFELDLGDVRQSARVHVNGKDYGTLITPPFRVVLDKLKPKGNVLEVEVTSVAANRIRDLDRRGVNWKIFKDINIVDVNYRPFNASNWPLTDCGLLGPVTLTAVTAAK